MKKDYFLFLCSPERQASYQSLAKECGYEFSFENDLESMLKLCVTWPPKALFLDIKTTVSVGSQKIDSFIEKLSSLDRQIMRCSLDDNDKTGKAFSMNMSKNDTLKEALEAIQKEDSDWKKETWRRFDIRVQKSCRTRWRYVDSDKWHRANILNLSCGGAFAVYYGEVELGESIEIEIQDLFDEVIKFGSRVSWCRTWDDSPYPPGFGFIFDAFIRREIQELIYNTFKSNQ